MSGRVVISAVEKESKIQPFFLCLLQVKIELRQ